MTKTHLYVVVMKGAGPRLKQDSGPRQDTQLFVLAYFKVSCKCLDVLFLALSSFFFFFFFFAILHLTYFLALSLYPRFECVLRAEILFSI